jgi:putative transposase
MSCNALRRDFMARLARVVAPGIPHHITQRGNRRQPTFFQESDYQLYLDLALEWSQAFDVQIWSYCLMPNHVHLIAVPGREESLAEAIGEIHRRYSRAINFRMGWRGHLWQGRFHSFPMDESYLLATARYIERNPVKAGLVKSPGDYQWSSARHHLGEEKNQLLTTSPLGQIMSNWNDFLSSECDAWQNENIRRAERSGRPLGCDSFVDELEKRLNRRLRKKNPGPKKIIE